MPANYGSHSVVFGTLWSRTIIGYLNDSCVFWISRSSKDVLKLSLLGTADPIDDNPDLQSTDLLWATNILIMLLAR